MAGTLHVCATPIGNLDDLSPRLRAVLGRVDVVYAEDTRRARTLLEAAGVHPPLRSHFAGNEAERSAEIVGRLAAGDDVAVLTDAGMPAVSDPGARAVAAAFEIGATVSVVAGPSAVTAAVAVSGCPADRFVFDGYLPKKASERRERLAGLAREERTVVLFATPHRLVADLSDLSEALGSDRVVCVARELTKLHEEIERITLGEAVAKWSERRPRGEYTLVLEGAAPPTPTIEEAVTIGVEQMADGASRSSAAREAAKRTGVDRRTVYERLGEGS